MQRGATQVETSGGNSKLLEMMSWRRSMLWQIAGHTTWTGPGGANANVTFVTGEAHNRFNNHQQLRSEYMSQKQCQWIINLTLAVHVQPLTIIRIHHERTRNFHQRWFCCSALSWFDTRVWWNRWNNGDYTYSNPYHCQSPRLKLSSIIPDIMLINQSLVITSDNDGNQQPSLV